MDKQIEIINVQWSLWFGKRLRKALKRTDQYRFWFREKEYEELVGRCGAFLVNGLKDYVKNFDGNFNYKEFEQKFEESFVHCEEEIQKFISLVKKRQ